VARVRVSWRRREIPARAPWGLISGELWWSATAMEMQTRRGRRRRTQAFDRRRRICPEAKQEGDWRWQGVGELRPLVVLLVSLRY
jgi:hypothetical protein